MLQADDHAPAGLWAPILTPLCRDGAIDPRRLGEHAGRLLDQGCDGVVLFGTTGEAPSFAREEKQRALEDLLSGGFPGRRLLVGTGCAALADAVALTEHARSSGVLGVLVLPPFYFKTPPRAGLQAYFDGVFAALGGPGGSGGGDPTGRGPLPAAPTRGLLYNFPRLAGLAIEPELAGDLLARHGELLIGMKDSSGDLESTRAFCRAMPGRSVFPGTEAILVESLAAGASGLVSATANLGAPLLGSILEAWWAGDREEAARLQAEAMAFRIPFERAGMIPGLKAALAERLGDPGWRRVRPPWTEAAR